MKKTNITIKDLAAHLGVTHSTISRALSPVPGRMRMSIETRDRILQAAKDMGYRPNGIARNLVQRRTRSIGVIVRHFNDPFYSNMIQELHVRFSRWNYLGVFFSARSMEEFQHAADSLLNHRVDGIISVALTPEERMRIRHIAVPILYYGIGSDEDDWVGPDHHYGATCAVSHLLEEGHRKIGFIGRTDAQNLRYQGFAQALQREGLSCHGDWIRSPGGDQAVLSVSGIMRSGYEQMLRLLALKDRPTAVVCHNDAIAIGAERAVLSCGLRVPDDMALVGFDGRLEGEYAAVPLTSVDPHMDRIVDILADKLFERVENRQKPTEPVQIRVVPSLIVRESTTMRRKLSSSGDFEAAMTGSLAREKHLLHEVVGNTQEVENAR